MSRRWRWSLFLPLLIIALGVGWLLDDQQVVPGVSWVPTLGLASTGLLILLAAGVNRLTVVVGPMLVLAAVLLFLHQASDVRIGTALFGTREAG